MRFLKACFIIPTFFCFSATVLLSGCAKENAFDCVKSTGKIITEKRDLPEFHTLRVFDNINVWLVPDSVSFAEVKCGRNLQENVQTEVKNGELWLRNINKCNWVRSYNKPMEIWVHYPEIETILHDGFGKISSAGTLKSEHLTLHVTGAGDLELDVKTESIWLDMYELGNIKLRGSNKQLNAMVMSSGKLECDELINQDAYLKMGGDGSAKVVTTKVLSAEISGRGNVFYSGNPLETFRQGNGEGQLIKAD